MAKLSSLVVDLQANTAALRTGLDQANGLLKGFGDKVSAASKLVAGLFVFDKLKDGIVGLTNFVESGAQVVDQLGKMSQAAGVTAEVFSAFDYAAKLSDVSTDDLSASFARLNKQMFEAATGGKQQQQLFRALGISVRDAAGNMRGADQVMLDLAEKFAGMKDGATKAAVGQEIFGKALASKLIPLLNQGRQGLTEATAEAAKFGQIVTTKGAVAAEAFNDSVTRLKTLSGGLARQIAQNLAPSLQALAQQLTDSASKSNALSMAAEGIAFVFRAVVSAGVILVGLLQNMGILLGGLAAMAVNLIKRDFKAVSEASDEMGNALRDNIQNGVARLQATWNTDLGAGPAMKKAADAVSTGTDKIIGSLGKMGEAAQKAKEELQKSLGDILSEAWMEGMDDVAKLEFRFSAFGDLHEKMKAAGEEGERLRDAILEAARTAQDLKINAELNTEFGKGTADRRERNNEGMTRSLKTTAASGFRATALQETIMFGMEVRDALATAGSSIVNAVAVGTNSLLNAMGGIGTIISGMVGALQQGDIGGAIVGALAEIMAQAPAFEQIALIAQGILLTLAEAFNGLIMSLEPLLGAVGALLETIVDSLTPVFEGLAEVFEALTPVVMLISEIIGPILTPVMKVLGFALKIFADVVWVIFDILRGIAVFILRIMKGLADVWNGILSAISGIFRAIGAFEIFGWHPFGFLLDWADSVDSAKINTEGLTNAIDDLNSITREGSEEQAKENAEKYKATAATKKTAESMNQAAAAAAGLTNIPALMKVNRLRGMAMDIEQPPLKVNLYIDGQQVYAVIKQHSVNDTFAREGAIAPWGG